MWRRIWEALAWLVGSLMGLLGFGFVIFAPLYLFYIWVSCEPAKNRRLSKNVTAIVAESINVVKVPRSEVDDGQVYTWEDTTTQYKYTIDGKEAHGQLADENIGVGTKFTLYRTEDGMLFDHPSAALEDYDKGYHWAVYSLLIPGVVMSVFAVLGIPVIQRHQRDTGHLENLDSTVGFGHRKPCVLKV